MKSEIYDAAGFGNLVKLAFLLKSYKNSSKNDLDIMVVLSEAIRKQYWEVILMLLSVESASLSKISLPLLRKHKKDILSAENLAKVGLSKETLEDALADKNNIGMLAHIQTGIRKPHISRGSLAIIDRQLASRIGTKFIQEYEEHKVIQEEILRKFELVVAIDNNHRGEAKQSAADFIEELKIWFAQIRNLPIEKSRLIYDIMQTVLMLADKGSPDEKSKYSVPVPIKINFNSTKPTEEMVGLYKYKHSIHIAELKSKIQIAYKRSVELPLLSIVLHELVHLQLRFMNGSVFPRPLEDWTQLAELLNADFLKLKGKIPEKFQRLNYFQSKYNQSEFAIELPTHLIEFYIKNLSLPQDTQIFSKKTIAEMHRLFDLLHKDLIKFKNDLLKKHYDLDEEKNPGRFKLFDYLQKGKLDKLSEYLTKDNYRAYNIMPLHLGDIEMIKHFEAHGFPLNLPDKLGVTPLEAAIAARKFQAAIYIMDKLIENDVVLPSSLKVDLQDEQGKNLLIHAIEAKASDSLIKTLVNLYSVPINAKDKQGKISVEYAIANGRSLEIVNLLADQLSPSNPIMKKVEAYRKSAASAPSSLLSPVAGMGQGLAV